jgi:hypothetical protein
MKHAMPLSIPRNDRLIDLIDALSDHLAARLKHLPSGSWQIVSPHSSTRGVNRRRTTQRCGLAASWSNPNRDAISRQSIGAAKTANGINSISDIVYRFLSAWSFPVEETNLAAPIEVSNTTQDSAGSPISVMAIA